MTGLVKRLNRECKHSREVNGHGLNDVEILLLSGMRRYSKLLIWTWKMYPNRIRRTTFSDIFKYLRKDIKILEISSTLFEIVKALLSIWWQTNMKEKIVHWC